ncbi:MAG: hypothetical protein IPI66_02690 [Chitinophagaceae bacterium]|nr:hypothetical protein [Chitinophagaceae bacterium]MBL0055090.1 hypothetical protein [Chitinophagaceae bacterium]
MIFVGNAAFGQPKTPSRVRYFPADSGFERSCRPIDLKKYAKKPRTDTACFQRPFSLITLLPANFYSSNLGFFCRQEIRFEKKTGLPFKFRLGSVQECDRLEGKGGSRLP